ncbi:CHAP domain-containing protein [Caballeronia sp. LZ062]|uniref:CHAP domain-containing protein n=1 Tax=unclassified Caballeronia TaxID=2646786 RepID=UPI0028566064|nr:MULTISPECIES: CHAP domain-containing protein [unclassified Caballeronia]MDR5856195.1 CHAP domain-containing protein [Caballeronia sp. LZ050]MDR5872866.1 CHAP domain-containing protein [Caballeronia sp. LZ062]
MERRQLLLGLAALGLTGCAANGIAVRADQDTASSLLANAPTNDPLETVTYLMMEGEQRSVTDKDTPPFNTRWTHSANPLIIDMFNKIGFDVQNQGDCWSWCAATVSWCLQHCGYSITSMPAWARSYEDYAVGTDNPRQGDLAVFEHTTGSGGHIAFYLDRTATRVLVRGGNQEQDVTGATECITGDRPNNKIKDSIYLIDGPAMKLKTYRRYYRT